MCSRLRQQLFQLRSLKIWRLLLSWMSCCLRRIAICPLYCEQLCGPETEAKQTPVCTVHPSLPQVSRSSNLGCAEVDSRCFLTKKERRTPTNDFGLSPMQQDVSRFTRNRLDYWKSVSEIEIIDEKFMSSSLCVHFGCADVDACFRSLRMHFQMCEYFCRKSIEAEWLGDVEIQGALVPSNRSVYPTQVSLPMGFSWATFFAQSVLCWLFGESLPHLRSQLLTDRSYRKVIPCQQDTASHYANIDKLKGVIAQAIHWW